MVRAEESLGSHVSSLSLPSWVILYSVIRQTFADMKRPPVPPAEASHAPSDLPDDP